MNRPRLILSLVILLCALLCAGGSHFPSQEGEPHTHEDCPCPVAPASSGWCDVCAVGYVGPVEIHSRYLHEVMDPHGHVVAPSSFRCTVCRLALETDGFCEEHRIGFVDKLAYFSRLTYELARWEPVDPSLDECRGCPPHAGEPAWCESCGLGVVGDVAIRDRQAFESALEAIRILRIADERAARCEHCAAAIVTDTECPIHRTVFRDGEEVSPAGKPGSPAPQHEH